jgi:hypothetical protein
VTSANQNKPLHAKSGSTIIDKQLLSLQVPSILIYVKTITPCRYLTASTAPYKYKQSGRQEPTTSYVVVRSVFDALQSTPAVFGLSKSTGVRCSIR